MTDLQILKELEKQLNVKFEEVDIIDIGNRKNIYAKYAINKQNNINGLAINKINIDDLTIIGKLKNITQLFLSDNQITDISVLQNLTKIQLLFLSDNQITDISFLQNLTKIESLFLTDNQIKDISVLQNLTKIEILNLSDNQITDISFLQNLTKIESLGLSDNQITNILPIRHLFKKEGFVFIDDNPLKLPPKEIAELGTKAISEYFEDVEKDGYTVLRESKIVIIGEAGAGKTTFAKKLENTTATMPKQDETTLGIDVFNWSFAIEQQSFNAKLWDFGGQDIYHGTHQFFFSNKSLYVLIADTRDQKTDFNYWLNTVEQLTGEDSRLVIISNKKYKHTNQIDEHGLSDRFGNIIRKVIYIDLSNTDQIPEMQQTIKKEIANLPQIGYALPNSWIAIRYELKTVDKNFIKLDKFVEICENNGIKSREVVKIISQLFTNIGIFTHFINDDTSLKEIIFLNSNWLTKTVYSLLNSEIVKDNFGRIDIDEIKQIIQTEELFFEVDKFVELMKKFSLIYRINNSKNYIVPLHLKLNRPYIKWQYADENNTYQFRYRFDNYMPKGIMAKLIVALHQYIYDEELVWKRGVNICNSVSNPNTYAEIQEVYGGENFFDIKIYGKNKKDLLQKIIYHFDETIKQFKKLRHYKLVPCSCETCKTSKKSHFFKQKNLLKAQLKNKKTVECTESFEDVDVSELLNGIDFTKLRSLLINEKYEDFKQLISQKFSDIPYPIHKKKVTESHFHSIFHTILAENGLNPVSEESTNDGRIDLHLTIGKTKYLFELKKDGKKEDAKKQIHDKKYYNKFLGRFDKIILLGVTFNSSTRNIESIEHESIFNNF